MKKLATLLVATAILAIAATSAMAANPVRISQIYGASSASNAYQADYIELFNSSNSPVSIGGWSLQYGGSTNTTGFQTNNVFQFPVGTTIPACGYFLVQGTSTTAGTLPVTPDAYTTKLDLNNTSGKIVLTNAAPQVLPCLLAGFTPPGGVVVEDLLGYGLGIGVCYETAAGPTEGAALVIMRGAGGLTDTDNNSADFTAVTVTPNQPVMHNSTMTNTACFPTPALRKTWGNLKSIYR
jgi:uncharacterized protein